MIVQLAPCRRECITDRDEHILVCAVEARLAADDDVEVCGKTELDTHLVDVPVSTSSASARERHATVGDSIVEAAEFRGAHADRGIESVGGRDVLESDLNRSEHVASSIGMAPTHAGGRARAALAFARYSKPLPTSDARIANRAPQDGDADADVDGMQRRILLVEPDRRAALALALTIRRAGDQLVGRATRVDDALRKVTTLEPELALVDTTIASEALATLRARCRVPVLLVADRAAHDLSSIIGPHVALDVGAAELAVMIELLCRGASDAMPPA